MDWHSRFLQQAAWTADLRAFLFDRAEMNRAQCVLEVGCGTGAVLPVLTAPAAVHGLDLDPARLVEAHCHAPSAVLSCGNALALPYRSGVFDITFCHFLFLWVPQPLQALTEMKRVTRPGGSVIALAEPDYTSRVDKPAGLAPLGRLQTEALERQGADTGLGKHLAGLFREAGIPIIETGPIKSNLVSVDGTQISPILPMIAEREMEWAVLETDLDGLIPADELQRMKALDEQAWARRERVLHVPTYFAWGVV
jgi:SAM-dependent methyltransferase